jgi:hypothetical protein
LRRLRTISIPIGKAEITMIAATTSMKLRRTTAAEDVVTHETGIPHPADSGHEWGEGADDRHEPGDDDRAPAVLLVERMRAVEVFLPEDADVVAVKDPWPDPVPDPVVHRVAQGGRASQDDNQPDRIKGAAGCQRPGEEQKRIAGEKRGNHQSCLGEDRDEQDGVCPDAVVPDDLRQVSIEVQEEI